MEPSAIEALIVMVRDDREAQQLSMTKQLGREEAWREAHNLEPLDLLEMPGADEQFAAWPRYIGLAAKYFDVTPLIVSMEQLKFNPVDALFDLKMNLSKTYEDVSPYQEEQELTGGFAPLKAEDLGDVAVAGGG